MIKMSGNKLKIIVLGLMVAALTICLPGDRSHSADIISEFNQTSWEGGDSTSTATHTSNQSGWNLFYSPKSPFITTTATKLTLSPDYNTLTDTTDIDFNQGTMSKVVVSGSGTDAMLQVTPSVADPFASTLGEWLTLAAQPRPGNFTAFCRGNNDEVYCLFAAGDGRQFGKFTPSTGRWTMLAPLPAPAAAGCAIAWDGEAIFALRGEGSKQCFKYTPGTDTWATFIPLAKGAEYGTAMCATGIISTKVGKLYVLLGGNNTDFVCFDPTIGESGVWISRSSAPGSIEEGGRLAYPGTGNYIYACRGVQTSTVWRYNKSNDTWDPTTPDLPIPAESTIGREGRMWAGSNMFWPGSGDYIYAAMPYECFNRSDIRNYQTFWRLGPLSGSAVWTRLADCPRYTNGYGFILYDPDGTGTEIQLLSGINYTNPWHYNIANNRWKELTQPYWIPCARGRDMYWVKNDVHSDVVLGTDGNDYECILNHTSDNSTKPITGASWQTYWRRLNPYDTATWVTGKIYTEGDIVVGTDSKDYRCIKYHLSANSNKPKTGADYDTYWQTPAVTTRGVAWTDAKAYVNGPYDDYIYWLGSRCSYDFWRYKISTNSWERRANLPFSMCCYGNRFADTGDGYLYVHTGTGTGFYRYDLATDTWDPVMLTNTAADTGWTRGSNVIGFISRADRVIGTDGVGYICKKRHMATSTNKPITGANWQTYWELNDPTIDRLTWTESTVPAPITYLPGHRVLGTDSNTYKCIKKHSPSLADKPVTGANWQIYWKLYTQTTECLTWVDASDYGPGLENIKTSIVVGTDGLDYRCIRSHTSAASSRPITGTTATWQANWAPNGTTGEGETWVNAVYYRAVQSTLVVGTQGATDYRCILDHVATADNRPITGANWSTYWTLNNTANRGNVWQVGTQYRKNAFGIQGHDTFIWAVSGCCTLSAIYDPLYNTWNDIQIPWRRSGWSRGMNAVWCGLNAYDKGKYIWLKYGRGPETTFDRYNIELDLRESMASSLVPGGCCQNSGSIMSNGLDSYIYHMNTASGDPTYVYRFERYDTSNNNWSELQAGLPFHPRYSTNAMTRDAIWISPYYGYDGLVKYDLTKPTALQPGIWSKLNWDTCYSSYGNGSIAVDNNGYLYMVMGDSYYYLNSNIWVFDTNKNQSKVLGTYGKDYDCILSHTSSALTQPITGANYQTYWQASRTTGKGAVWANSTAYYCSKHANRWVDIIRAPFYLGPGVKAQYMSTQNAIFVLQGSSTKNVWKYDITNKRWGTCPDAPVVVTIGSEIAGGCGVTISGHQNPRDVIFMQGGNNSTQFNEYFVEPSYNFWTSVLNSPDGHDYFGTNSMTYSSYDNKVYKLRTEVTDTAYVYNPANDTWGTINPVGVGSQSGNRYVCDEGSVIYYPNDGNKYVYVFTGEEKRMLERYNIDTTNWDELLPVPTAVNPYGSAMASVGNNYIYIYNTTQLDYLYRYHKTENTYDIPAYLPVALASSGVMCGYKGNIYYLVGGTGDFYRFNIGAKLWGTLAKCPFSFPNADPCLKAVEYEGNVSLYVTGGQGRSEFYKYNVATDAWTLLEPPLYAWGWGNAISHVKNDEYIYALRGGAVAFWKYDIRNNTWDVLADVPVSIGRGAALTYPDKGNFLYALSGNRSANFYAYNYKTDQWITKNPCMVKVLDCHSELIYPGFGNYLYVLHGSSWAESFDSYTYIRYNILTDTWNELAPASFGVKYPGSMIWPGGEYYYATKGSGRFELAMYYAFCYGSYISGIKPAGAHCGWGNVSWTFNDTQAAEISFRSGNQPDLSDALSWDLCADLQNGSDLSLASSIKPKDVYVQYKIGFSTDNLNQLPRISDVTIQSKFYPIQQEVVSSPYNTTFPANRLVKFEWTDTQGIGTDVRFKMRTGSTLNNLLAAPWYGPGGTTIEHFNYGSKSDYMANSEVLFTGSTVKLHKKLADFAYSQTFYLDNTGGSAQSNLVVTLQISLANTSFWNNIKSDGSDMRFHDGTQELSYYLSSFDKPNKIAKINVRLPSVGANSIKTFYMVYGSTDALSASNVDCVNKPSGGLVGYWNFNEGAGSLAADSSGYNNTGALYPIGKNMPKWTTKGKYGAAIYFDSIDDYVRVTVPDLGTTYTMAFWATIDTIVSSQKSWQTAISCATTYPAIMLHPNNWMYYYWINITNDWPGYNWSYHTKRDEVWRHYTVVQDPLGQRCYTNGVLNSWPISYNYTSRNTPSMQWYIGRYFINSTYYWKGYIDEVVFYNRPLSHNEVKYLYEGQTPEWTYKISSGSNEVNATCASLVAGGWQKKIAIPVQNTGTLKTNSVVRIDLLRWYEFWAHVKSDGSDIRVVDADDSTVLTYCVPQWDYANKKGFILVQVPTLATNSTKTIYLYYGNSGAVSAANPAPFIGFEENFDSLGQVAGDSPSLSGWLYKIPLMLKNDSGSNYGRSVVIGTDGKDYFCKLSHTSSNSDRPTSGGSWSTYWQDNLTTGQGTAWSASSAYESDAAVVRVDVEDGWTSFWNNVRSDGADVRIVAADNTTVMNYWLDYFDKDQKKGSFLVKVPFIKNGTQQVYWLYYGKSDATSASTDSFLFPLKAATSVPTQVSRVGTTFQTPWLYKMDVVVNNLRYIPSLATNPIPVINRSVNINIPPTWTDFWANIRPDGGDILFYDEGVTSGNPINLNYDWNYFDYNKKIASFDVEVQSYASTTWPRTVSIYYGKQYYTSAAWNVSSKIYNAFDLAMYSSLDETRFTAGGAVTADKSPIVNQGYVTLLNNSNAWDSYLKWNGAAYTRVAGRVFQAKIYAQYYNNVMIGWKDNDVAGLTCSNLAHGIYFSDGSLYIYEDGTNAKSCGTYLRDLWYEIKIELKVMGARYYLRKSDETAWTLLYDSLYSTESNLRPFISHHNRDYYTRTDDWKVFLDMTYDVVTDLGSVIKGVTNTFSLNEYYQDNPTLQPMGGVFYDANIVSVTETSTVPAGSGLRHQISPDAWNWYWYNSTAISKVVGTDLKDYRCKLSHTSSSTTQPITGVLYENYWEDNNTTGQGSVWASLTDYNSIPIGWNLVAAGYSQANTGAEINANIATFQTLFPTGSFNFRTYLHSETGTYTPELDNIAVALNSDETFYTDKTGSIAINPLNSDIANDQWVQYKAILYSDGRNAPTVNSVKLTYVDTWLNITAPNGGESWLEGRPHNITWTSQGIDAAASHVKLEYAPDNEATWKQIIASTLNTGTYSWTPPNDPGLLTKVRITSVEYPAVTDKSNASFRLIGAEITSPNGGEIWELGRQHAITWDSGGTLGSDTLKFEYSLDNGATWVTPEIASGQTDDGDLTWNITTNLAHASDNVKVRMTDSGNTQVDDSSNAIFALVPQPVITFTFPLGAEELKVGAQYNVTWTTNSQQFGSQFELRYSKDNFVSSDVFIATVSSGAPATPLNPNTDLSCSYAWTVPDDLSDSVKIKVKEVAAPVGRDTSTRVEKISSVFKIVNPRITITKPNGGELWVKGETNNITWTSEGTINSGSLALQYSKDGGSNWINITGFDGINDGLFAWTVPLDGVSDLCKVRIKDLVRPAVTDDSDNTFKIIPAATIEVRIPNGGEIWTIGDTYTITWEIAGQIGGHDVLIEYSKDNFVNDINIIKPSTPNDGSESWVGVPNDPSADVKVRITSIQDPTISDKSDAAFTICTPGITLISPNGGELWEVRNPADPTQIIHNIKWVSGSGVPDGTTDIVLKMSTNSGASYDTTIATGRDKTGLYPWSVPNNVGSQIRVKAYSFGNPTKTDESNADFSIVPVPSMTITTPLSSGLTVWKVGAYYDITWSKVGNLSGTVDLYYSTNGTNPTNLIAQGVPNSGTYRWRVPNVGLTSLAKVRVIESTVPTRDTTKKIESTSMIFSIVDPVLTITSPNGAPNIVDAEAWVQGEQNYISWIPDGLVSNGLLIEYSRDSGASPTRYTIYDGIVPGTGLTPGSTVARAIAIDNTAPSAANLTDYQVQLTINTSALIPAKMRADGFDIMFADEDEVCPYWIEPNSINTTQTKIWVKVPQIPAGATKKIYMYYGNPNSAVNMNFDNTFVKNVISDQIAGYWHFDEKQGVVAYDASGAGRDLSISGATWHTSDGGRWSTQQNVSFSTGSCLVFNGAGYAGYDNITTDPQRISMEAWIYPTDVSTEGYIMQKTGATSSYYLKIAAGGALQFCIYDATNTAHIVSGNQSLVAGTPYHVAGTYDATDGGKIRLYVNGALQADVGTSAELNTTASPFKIGNTFKGRIDEVSIHNKTLSLAEITAHFERRKYASVAPSTPVVQVEEPINKYLFKSP